MNHDLDTYPCRTFRTIFFYEKADYIHNFCTKARQVLEITEMIVNRDHLTTMMITHNMQDAITHGNRLIMMMEGKIILDIQGEEKKKLTVRNLLDQFEKASGQEFSNDSALLS